MLPFVLHDNRTRGEEEESSQAKELELDTVSHTVYLFATRTGSGQLSIRSSRSRAVERNHHHLWRMFI